MSLILDRPTPRLGRRSTAATTGVVPPAGPAWFGSVMGTGILATLLQLSATKLPGAHTAATVLLGVGWLLLLGLTSAFVHRARTTRGALRASLTGTPNQTQWGMVAMGILATGSTTLTVLPTVTGGATHLAAVGDAVLWTAGTVLGLVTAFGFPAALLGGDRGNRGAPGFAWGLPVVPPMVSATTGAALVPHVGSGPWRLGLVVLLLACFGTSLVLGSIVFAVAYRHHWRVAPVSGPASATTWIPLGVVGQSTAAAQAIAHQAAPLLATTSRSDLRDVADGYGIVMLAIGIPLVAYAVVVTLRGFRSGMPFSPGWWALTFPLGTLALGAHLLGGQPGLAAYGVMGLVCVLALCGTWSVCAVASIRAVAAETRSCRSASARSLVG